MSKSQKTVYIDKDFDKDLIDYIGDDPFSASMLKLAKIGAQIERLGVSDIMRGLMLAKMSETDALTRALEIILEHRMIEKPPVSASVRHPEAIPKETYKEPHREHIGTRSEVLEPTIEAVKAPTKPKFL